MDPLIVTLTIDEEHQRRFDAQRREHFPPGRTVIGAHVTLFHALPGDEPDAAHDAIRRAAARSPFEVSVTDLYPLGRGVAYRLRSVELEDVHRTIRDAFANALTAQDAQPFRPHVTVQNKATPETAARTLRTLRETFVPFTLHATGLALWRYAGGPWTALHAEPFAAR